jgi:hypothetical protein
MPRGGNRNDPLAGWGKENLAAPKRRQAQNVQATQYDDDDGTHRYIPPRGSPPPQGTPTRGRLPSRMRSEYRTPSPSRGPATRGRPPSHMRSEYRTPSFSPQRTTHCDSSYSPPHPFPPARKHICTNEEKSASPFGDTRWPPKGEYLRPLHLRYELSGVKKVIYYNLIYQNTAFEAIEWLRDIEATAAEATSNIPDEEAPQITIMNAFISKKLRVISEGNRGKIWILDKGCKGVWARMESMAEERGAVRVSMGWVTFAVFGICLKGNNGDVLLISWDFPAEQARMPK